MRILRRVFVESAVALGAVAIAAAVLAVVGGSSPAWLGVGLAWLPIVGYLIYLLIARPSTHTRHLWVLHAVALTGVVIAAFAGPIPVAIALPGLAAMLGYVYWYSRQHVPTPTIRMGARLPDFPLEALDGSQVSSAVFGSGARVIMFYRGNWCPFCMVQVRQLAAQYRELASRGVGVALISPQRPDETAALATRFDIPMDFYIDRDGAAAKVLDMVQAGGVPAIYGAGTNGDTVVPTVVITGRDGKVVWVTHSDNHRIRPEPSAFLEVLDRAGIVATS